MFGYVKYYKNMIVMHYVKNLDFFIKPTICKEKKSQMYKCQLPMKNDFNTYVRAYIAKSNWFYQNPFY